MADLRSFAVVLKFRGVDQVVLDIGPADPTRSPKRQQREAWDRSVGGRASGCQTNGAQPRRRRPGTGQSTPSALAEGSAVSSRACGWLHLRWGGIWSCPVATSGLRAAFVNPGFGSVAGHGPGVEAGPLCPGADLGRLSLALQSNGLPAALGRIFSGSRAQQG